IDHHLSVTGVLKALVALRHDLQLWIGEVGLGFVVGYFADRPRLLAGPLLAGTLPLGLRLGATLPLGFSGYLGLLLQTLFGLQDLGQTLLAESQFVGQFVAAPRPQDRVLGLVRLLRLLEQR